VKLMQGMIDGGEKNSGKVLAKVGLRKAVCLAWRGDLD
jgi:hypothetical protein